MSGLEAAAKRGDARQCEHLLQAGEDPNTVGKKDWTALHHAASKNFLAVVKVLLNYGADGLAKTKDGKTPLQLARGEEVQKFLKKWEDEEAGRKALALFQDLENLLIDGRGVYDLTIALDDKSEHKAHQCLVGIRCKFMEKLIHAQRDSNAKRGENEPLPHVTIEVEGITAPEMKIILMFLYTGKLGETELSGKDLVPLLFNSRRLGLLRCAALVENKIRTETTEDNVLATYRAAHELKQEELEGFCLHYIVTWYNKVVKKELTVVGGELLAKIMVTQANPDRVVPPKEITIPSGSLRDELKELLTDQRDCDYALPIRDNQEGLKCHRAVLCARSKYYTELFAAGKNGEGDEKIFPSPDCQEAFLTFLYSDGVLIRPQDALYLWPHVGQNAFGLSANELLRGICEHSLNQKVDASNVLEVYKAACDVDVRQLKEIAVNRLVEDFKVVSVQEDLASLSKPQLLDMIHAYGHAAAKQMAEAPKGH